MSEIGQPQTRYGQLVMRWADLWRTGHVPLDEYNKLLKMQVMLWAQNGHHDQANGQMIEQLEAWIRTYEKEPAAPERSDRTEKKAAYEAAAMATPPASHDEDQELF